ncbi:MAG: 2-oxoglutarate oxidoreductase [Clostridia bacterium]|nr:2-oxoglutarate oxidoreductase [Clostridia bacterium]
MDKVYARPASLTESVSRFCPGCLHGLVVKMLAELIDEFDLRKNAACILPVGCGTMAKNFLNVDVVCAIHGRAPAVATGFKRSAPDRFVFTYQGDGDLGAIGFSEIMHAANRGEKFMTVFINNSTYGMTGGQMAPTTLIGQKTTTTPYGRNPANEGYPMKMCELIAQLEAPVYVARFALDTPANILKAKAGLKKAFEINLKGQGFAFVELLSTCPTNWGMNPVKCLNWMQENTMKIFPPGVYKMKDEVK